MLHFMGCFHLVIPKKIGFIEHIYSISADMFLIRGYWERLCSVSVCPDGRQCTFWKVLNWGKSYFKTPVRPYNGRSRNPIQSNTLGIVRIGSQTNAGTYGYFPSGDSPVRTPKILDSPVRTPKILDSPVRTPKISDSPVRTPKISDSPVRTSKVSWLSVRHPYNGPIIVNFLWRCFR